MPLHYGSCLRVFLNMGQPSHTCLGLFWSRQLPARGEADLLAEVAESYQGGEVRRLLSFVYAGHRRRMVGAQQKEDVLRACMGSSASLPSCSKDLVD